ncbi:type VI secretion system protein TssA [Pseudomonas aeruginosa]|nr:type VI secretion system protein TssA [Pseudomonas aeruginosa]
MTYSSKLSSHYLELAEQPISKDVFAGEDVRFSSEYEALENELGKALSLHENGQTDWLKILENSEALLRAQSKDLRVAAWLTWALYQRESFPGLLAGLGLLERLCSRHWVEIHPLKARTRAAAIGWLVPRLEQALNENVPIKEQLPCSGVSPSTWKKLDTALTAQLGDDAPLLRRSADAFRACSSAPPTTSPNLAWSAPWWPRSSRRPASCWRRVRHRQRARRPQGHARPAGGRTPPVRLVAEAESHRSRALRLNRTMLWLPIESMPERNAEQVTALRGVPADKLKSYQERFAQGLYADLLVELEASLARAPFWFDGQRLVWECLQGLNAEQAMREVEMHFALLLQRLPGLVELRFHDGSAFADAVTRGWISAHVMPHLQNDSAPRKVETVVLQAEWDVALDEVQPVLRKDGLKAAVQVLKQGMKRAHGGRARFFWQLSLARLCFLAKKYELAKTQLESLDHQLHESGLHAWEPDLALDVLHLLHSCCELLPQNHAVRERKEDIYRRLCHLDLEVVLE